MQTFLPSPDFYQASKMLDTKRLNKQVVGTRQILAKLGVHLIKVDGTPFKSGGTGWINRPAVKMWIGYSHILSVYHDIMLFEAIHRGMKTRIKPILSVESVFEALDLLKDWEKPYWMEDQTLLNKVVRSHQSNLLRKDSQHYGPWFPGVPDNLDYYWPTDHPTRSLSADAATSS